MKIEMDKLPQKGCVYSAGAQVYFATYSILDGHMLLSDGRDLNLEGLPKCFSVEKFSEIHFFDEKNEYRILRDDSKVRTFLLTEADDINNPDYVIIREDAWVRPEFQPGNEERKITIVNRFEYTDDDRLCLTNYRLSANTLF